jgi:hypothetical protein
MIFDFRALRAFGAALLVGVAATAAGCSDDPAPAPPPRYAPITVFNAITDVPAALQFKIGETVLTSNSTYGNPTTVTQALVGDQTEVKVLTNTGTQLSSARVAIDTGRSVWVIAAGEALAGKTPSIFGVSHVEPTAPAGRALVRIIHAGYDLGKVDVHESDAFGATIATNLDYKGASNFSSISPAVTNLSVTATGSTTEKLSIPVSPRLDSGRVYNVIIYGTANQDAQPASIRVQGKIVPEP